MTKKFLDAITYEIVGAAIEVHKVLGPGLLESIYHECLAHEFNLREIPFRSQFSIPVYYKNLAAETQFRCDFFVDDAVVVEIKAVDAVMPIHEAFLFTYLKLLKCPKGIMINFNCLNIFKEGQKTYVNEFFRNLPD